MVRVELLVHLPRTYPPGSRNLRSTGALRSAQGRLATASVAALAVAERIQQGEIDTPHDSVVTIFPDSGERYLSKGIYRSFEEWEG